MVNSNGKLIATAAASFAAGIAFRSFAWTFFSPSKSSSNLKHSLDLKRWNARALDPNPPKATENWVEVYDEPFHFVEMDNKFCRVIRFRFPAGERTLYHRHKVDSFFVFFSSTRVRNEKQGEKPVEFDIAAGGAADACYCTEPIIHRISNIGNGWMHGLDIEIKSVDQKEYKRPCLQESDNLKIICKGKTMHGKHGIRVYRVSVAPGKSAYLSFPFKRLEMCQQGSLLSVKSSSDETEKESIPRLTGSYCWSDDTFEGTVENRGDKDYILFVAEWH
uniref:Uncharacterized protein n=1 Tax=Lotharella oceanica TaxID=641309 RepID=A0A7S2TMF1_9EUKA|mmetsp:Transcript_20412/g.38413  ORF Transcript_20412/g.38413 Transcript_20412/m.38413 type:complete len:276 (+) Transcript_20412:34-861(+)